MEPLQTGAALAVIWAVCYSLCAPTAIHCPFFRWRCQPGERA